MIIGDESYFGITVKSLEKDLNETEDGTFSRKETREEDRKRTKKSEDFTGTRSLKINILDKSEDRYD